MRRHTNWPAGYMGEQLEAIYNERVRQDDLKREGRFKWTCADPEMSDSEKLAVLMEEVGEAARCINEQVGANDKHNQDLRTELIQVAAVAAAWAESLAKEDYKRKATP